MINVWGTEHLTTLTNVILAKYGLDNYIEYHLSCPVATNLFLQLPLSERIQFVQETLNNFGRSENVLRAFSVKPYAPFLLLDLIERDTFMKQSNYDLFDESVKNTSSLEVNIISNGVRDYDEKFLKFYRYIDILSAEDPKKVHGQKFLNLISSIQAI